MADTPEQTLDIRALEERLGLRPAEIYREIKQGRLKCATTEGGTTFSEEDVRAFLEQRDSTERDITRETEEWLRTLAPPPGAADPSPKPASKGVPEDGSGEPAEEALDQKQDRLPDALLNHALSGGALDVYVDPVENGCRILYRLAGAVHETGRLSAALGDVLRQRLRGRLGAADPAPEPRSGVFTIEREGLKIQVRGTVAPTLLGEHIHLALQDAIRSSSLEQIGYTPVQAEALRQVLNGSPGAFVSVGPIDPFSDGHRLGLAAILAEGDRLVISLERRPQLKSEALVQLQVGASEGTGFISMFHTALAMSPSVLFIDDIRTPEEAKAVFEGVAAGMTVVAHIRAADNVEALLRLAEAGVSRNVLARDILGLSAQRVVRGVCRKCRSLRNVTEEEAELFSLPTDASLAVPHGCEECSDGFAGRRVFRDLWVHSPALAGLVLEMTPPAEPLYAWGRASALSLVRALRDAVVAGEVQLADVAPLLLSRATPDLCEPGHDVKD